MESETHTAKGPFEVTLTPVTEGPHADDPSLGLLTIAKTFSGDLEGASVGRMLTGMTPVRGSAGYVAMERVTGTLDGKRGSFILQHSGTMSRGEQSLSVTIVPDSGTDELEGIAGSMRIEITEGKHFYELEYAMVHSRH